VLSEPLKQGAPQATGADDDCSQLALPFPALIVRYGGGRIWPDAGLEWARSKGGAVWPLP